jgi:hypothetical protein
LNLYCFKAPTSGEKWSYMKTRTDKALARTTEVNQWQSALKEQAVDNQEESGQLLRTGHKKRSRKAPF